MADSVEWCDLCELPRSTCVHGMAAPPLPPAAVPVKAATTRKRSPARPASRARSEAAAKRPDTRVNVRRTTRAQTPASAYRSHIVAVLEEHDGSLEGEDLLDAVHGRMSENLLDGDHETVSGGETRWRYAARQERAAMTKDGVLAPPRRPGLWELA